MSEFLSVYLKDHFAFSEEETNWAEKYFVFEKVSKKQFLVREGDLATDFFLIMDGWLCEGLSSY